MNNTDDWEKAVNAYFQANIRESMIAQLRAEGTPAPDIEATADRMIAAIARAAARSTLELLEETWGRRPMAGVLPDVPNLKMKPEDVNSDWVRMARVCLKSEHT